MSTAIRIEGLAKQYRLGEVGTGTLSHDLNRWWARLRGKEDPYAEVGQTNARDQEAQTAYVWALRDIDLDVQTGEILGIVGLNGAGKSTLLKLLSRVTAPTLGSISTKGRIASLLEVGTGFHPELTGRENVFLNGAILGMQKQEIQEELDAIVEFSGCKMYLDTPVKRYSSGMKVRLGFAVAAHLRSEILIIDEVLAVGDWDFQKRCIEKMKDVASSGRTLLFVSHNMASVRQLCTRSVLMHQGRIRSIDETDVIVDEYMRLQAGDETELGARRKADPAKPFQLFEAHVENTDGERLERFSCGQGLVIKMRCESREPLAGLYGYLQIIRVDGTVVLVTDSYDGGDNPLDSMHPGDHQLVIRIPRRILGHGDYQVTANFTSRSFSGFNVDSPGVIAKFSLFDDETRRGNTRRGVLSTAPNWECHPESSTKSRT